MKIEIELNHSRGGERTDATREAQEGEDETRRWRSQWDEI
jgi:hypothetical protein